jgi:hypothetical protein
MAYSDLLAMGVEKAYAVRHLVTEGPPAAAAEWVEKAKTLSVVDLTREVRHARAGKPASAQFDYLVGVARRLMALAGGLAESDEPCRVLADIRTVCLDAEAWLDRESRQNGLRAADPQRPPASETPPTALGLLGLDQSSHAPQEQEGV